MTPDGRPYRILARFNPKRRDDLQERAWKMIGSVFRWEYCGGADADEPYPGQSRWQVREPWFGWAPDEDLEEIWMFGRVA